MGQLATTAKTARIILKEQGIKALFQKYGWKLVAVLFFYYLVRDLTLYVFLPMLLIRSF